MPKILKELETREILKDITNIEKFNNLPKNCGVYIGFDPTASSLHLGNYIQINILKIFESFGFKVFAILGGATGMIGDPSGKSNERNLLSKKDLINNKQKIKLQLEKFGLNVIDNFDFYKDILFLDFLRDVGKNININYMLSKEMIKNRLDTGISFTEFSYQLIQAYDFKCLYEKYNIMIQIGGSDQWGNITTGIELIRKAFGENNSAVGITTNLLTTSNGQKFGKTANNAIWLDEKMTLPYFLYQYLYNLEDSLIFKYYSWLRVDLEPIKNKNILNFQEILAFDVVKDIHGIEIANKIKWVQKLLFSNLLLNTEDLKKMLSLLPSYKFTKNILLDVLVETKICVSKREARELIIQNSIMVNKKLINNFDFPLLENYYLIKKGKKWHYLIYR